MSLAFRNIDVSPGDPVDTWPTEAVLTALERGGLAHWQRLAAAVRDDPWGPLARRPIGKERVTGRHSGGW